MPNGYNISPKDGHNVKGCMPKETREKLRQSHVGLKASEETKQKMRNSKLGEKNYMFGKGFLISGEKTECLTNIILKFQKKK